MQFKELTDKQWNVVKQYLPKPAKTGRPRSNDRRIINGIIYVLISGCRWSEMPKRYGFKSTANRRLQLATKRNLEKDSCQYNQDCSFVWQTKSAKNIS